MACTQILSIRTPQECLRLKLIQPYPANPAFFFHQQENSHRCVLLTAHSVQMFKNVCN